MIPKGNIPAKKQIDRGTLRHAHMSEGVCVKGKKREEKREKERGEGGLKEER